MELVKLKGPITTQKVLRAIKYRADREAHVYRYLLGTLYKFVVEAEAEISRRAAPELIAERHAQLDEFLELLQYAREAIHNATQKKVRADE